MRIAYIVPTPDLFTYIVNEMAVVQNEGHEIVLVPLRASRVAEERRSTVARVRAVVTLPATLCDLTVICIALWVFLSHPVRVLKVLCPLHWSAGFNMFCQAKLIATTPKALATAWRLRRVGVCRIHAHFASNTATCAGIAGFISRIPFSFTAHAYDIYCTDPRLRNDTLIWKLRHAIQIFAVSDHAASFLKAKLPSARDRIHTVRVGIPLNIFTVEPPLPLNGMLELLSICYFHNKKGLHTLIDACALLRNQMISFRLRLFGDGPLRAALQAHISRLSLGGHVTLGGAISQEEVSRQMKACHLFVLPCRRDQTGDMDGIPTVFMEAMASGRPVITCPITGIPELVRHGETGVLVPVRNPDVLAAAILRLARDDSLRACLGHQARALVERNHNQISNAQRLLALMNQVSQRKGV